MVARRRAAAIVRPARGDAERLHGIVMTRAPDDDGARAGERLTTVVVSVRVRLQHRRRPLSQIAEQVVNVVRARARGPRVGRLGGVVPSPEHGARRRRWRIAPRIPSAVGAPRRLFPLRLPWKPAALPRAVVAGAETGGFDHGVALVSAIDDPAVA